MEIHIQLAGVELGPFSEKQVREYLAEDLLTLTDPARFEGTETWGVVRDVLGILPPAPTPAPPEKPAPKVVEPQASMAHPAPPASPSALRKSTAVTTALPRLLDAKSKDTIRVPIPQLTKSLAKQTTQALITPVPQPPSAVREVATPAKASEKTRTSLLTAVKILGKKSDPGAGVEATQPIHVPEKSSSLHSVPLTFPKSEIAQTMPMTMGRSISKKSDRDDKLVPVEQKPTKPNPPRVPEVPAVSSKSMEMARTVLLPSVKALHKKANQDDKPASTVEPSTAPKAPDVPSAVLPQMLRTAPMSAVKALPKKMDSIGKAAPASSEKSIEAATPSLGTVRFVPGETPMLPPAETKAKAPPVSPESVFSSKTLHRTTGSLPTLVKTLAKKPDEVVTPTSPAEPKTPSDSPEETVAEKVPWLRSPAPFPSLIRSLAGKMGLMKSEAPIVTDTPPEISEPIDKKPEVAEKAPEITAKKPEPIDKKPEIAQKTPEITVKKPEPIDKKPEAAQKTPEIIAKKSEVADKKLEIAETKSEAVDKKRESTDKIPELADEKPKAADKLPKIETPVDKVEPKVEVEPLPKSDEPLPQEKTKQVSIWPIFVFGGLVMIVGVAFLVLFYIHSSYQSANSLLKALKDGDQAQLQKLIDFPAVRQTLTDEVTAQMAKSGDQNSSSNAAVLAMNKNSINYYVTPEAISALATKSDKLPQAGQDPTIAPTLASAILLKLNTLPVKSQKLVSFNHLVVDLDAAKLDLQYGVSGWKLNRIELNSNFQPPQEPGAPAASPDLGSSLDVPVIETYLADAQAKFQKADWDGAIADYTKVLDIDPKQTVAYSNRGMARRAKKDLDGAIADFNQAISLDPKLAEAYDNRGDVKSAQHDLDGALADYTQAVNLDPKLAGAFYNRGTIRTLKSDYDGAISDFTENIALDPNNANAYSNRGVVRQTKNDLDGAIADYTQALAINPKIAVAYCNRGLAKQAKADLDGAILDYNQALDLDPKMTRAYYSRGIAKNTKNDLDGAIADYNQALTLDPKLAPTLTDRALARQAKGDLKGALADFNEALAIDPKIGSAYYSRGLIKEQLNDLDGAINDSSRALDFDPKRAQAYYNRGFAKLVKGNLDGARSDFQKFCELAPKDPYADHARLYLWLIGKAQNPTGTANQELSDALQDNWSLTTDDLVTKIAGFLLDRITEADLIAAAVSPDPKKDSGQHCEVWYFAGMKRLLAGDKTTAIDYFHKCLETGQKDYCEYILAQAELQVLVPVAPPTP